MTTQSWTLWRHTKDPGKQNHLSCEQPEPHLERHKECDCLYRIVASVHIVAHEQVVGVGGLPSNLEKLHEVVELAVDIAAYSDGTSHLLYIWLLC